jgi:hypothetical protein
MSLSAIRRAMENDARCQDHAREIDRLMGIIAAEVARQLAKLDNNATDRRPRGALFRLEQALSELVEQI